MILLRVYACLDDFAAVEREAEAALAAPGLAEPAKLVLVPGAQALARFQAGHLAEAADAARAAERRRGGWDSSQHFFAVDHLRALAGLALERRDLDTAEQLAEQALSISGAPAPAFEFLDAAGPGARSGPPAGRSASALATVEAARRILAGTGSVLLAPGR